MQYLVFLLCSCVPMTPFDSKHVFRHIYWLLFWLCSAVNSPACKAWSPCALCSLFSLLLKQMLWSISRFVSLFKHHGTSYLGLQRSTKEHLCIFFSQDEPECMKYFYQEKVPGWGSSTPGAARLCQRFVNRWGCTAMEHIYFNFQHHVLKYLICLVIAIKMPNICTRYHFATLFDTNRRIAVYSAYYFQPSDGGGREKRWFVEPQVGVNFFFFVSMHQQLKWST